MREKNKMCTMEEITFVEQHLNEMSNQELAKALGVTINHVHAILAYYQLRRNADGRERASAQKGETWMRLRMEEMERVKQGLPQLTNIRLNKKFLAKYQRV